MALQRLQKFLAGAGIASRRHSEALILAGRIAVNGQTITQLGAKVDSDHDTVTFDNRPVTPSLERVYVLLHKPPGYVTTAADERGRPTVLSLLPPLGVRVFPVGRLDVESEGLLLLTDDGELAHRLTHPRYGFEREYRALVSGVLSEAGLAQLRAGTVVQGRRVVPARVTPERGTEEVAATPAFWLRIVLQEGRKREVREICRAAGYPVLRLIRVRYGPLSLRGLPPGAFRPLTRREIAALKQAVGLEENPESPPS